MKEKTKSDGILNFDETTSKINSTSTDKTAQNTEEEKNIFVDQQWD